MGKCESTVLSMEGYYVKCLIHSASVVSIMPISEARRMGIETLKKAELLMCANQEVIEYFDYFKTNIKIFWKVVKDFGFLMSMNDRLKVVGMNILNKLPEYRNDTLKFKKIYKKICVIGNKIELKFK